MTTNIVTAAFGGSKVVRTRALYQWDYGQVLQFSGIDLPDAYTVHFSNQGVGGEAKTMVGNADGVDIPDEYLATGQTVYAWVYLHAGESDGETMYSIIIPVVARPQPTEDEPTPVQQGAIDQAIAALNDGVDRAEAAAEAAEQAVEGVQDSIDAALQEAKDSGEFDGADGVSPTATVAQTSTGATISVTDAEGTTTAEITNGRDGATGPAGADGISPTITVTDITGGHRVVITDEDGPHTFDVMDGEGAVESVNGKTGAVVLDAGDIGYDDQETYDAGTVGAELGDLKTEIGDKLDTPAIPGTSGQVLTSDGQGGQSWEIPQALVVTVTGSTPTITALPGIRYVCGEVTTLDITLPASGIVDVVFESGATATVLTVTPPTGVTVKWANGFDPTALEADTTYEINVCDGLGVAGTWS